MGGSQWREGLMHLCAGGLRLSWLQVQTGMGPVCVAECGFSLSLPSQVGPRGCAHCKQECPGGAGAQWASPGWLVEAVFGGSILAVGMSLRLQLGRPSAILSPSAVGSACRPGVLPTAAAFTSVLSGEGSPLASQLRSSRPQAGGPEES